MTPPRVLGGGSSCFTPPLQHSEGFWTPTPPPEICIMSCPTSQHPQSSWSLCHPRDPSIPPPSRAVVLSPGSCLSLVPSHPSVVSGREVEEAADPVSAAGAGQPSPPLHQQRVPQLLLQHLEEKSIMSHVTGACPPPSCPVRWAEMGGDVLTSLRAARRCFH